MKQKIISIPISILILIIGLFLGIKLQDFLNQKVTGGQEYKFNEVLNYTSKYYFEEIEPDKLVESAIKGMFDELDPHTTYINIEEERLSQESFRGEFDGIGVEFQIIKDTITVVSPIVGGPSDKVGVLAGDKITRIEGESCIGFSNIDVINTLRGEKGSPVNLTIYRPINKREFDFEIVRDKIPMYSIDVSLIYQDSIGYISLSRFSETTTKELLKNLEELKSQGMKRIILDLRNNPGGILSQAVNVADLFLNENKLIVFTEGRITEFNEEFVAKKEFEYENYPLVILINQGSASASEIVAGAVQDWDRGWIVGENSFGKGLVQRPFLLSDDSAIRLTVSRYMTPSGRAIQRDYSNGKDKYYSSIHNDSLISNTDSIKEEFMTSGGRTVYGGGGIHPDSTVKQNILSDYSVELIRNNIFYQFIRFYLDKNSLTIKNKFGDDLEYFANEFSLASELFNFRKFAERNQVEFDKTGFEKDKQYILRRLKAYVAREFWNSKGWYYIQFQEDKQFQTAITLFDSPLINPVK